MGVVAPVTLLTMASLEEIAHLGFVNAVRDAKVAVTMSKGTVLPLLAAALEERLAKFGLLKVWSDPQLIC